MEQLGLEPSVLEQIRKSLSQQKDESARPNRTRPSGLPEGNGTDVCEDAG
ncbi:hypothetical protein ACFOSW_26675 [Paenibacillus sp. GCM10012303]